MMYQRLTFGFTLVSGILDLSFAETEAINTRKRTLKKSMILLGPNIYARARKQSWLNERKLKDEQERM